MIEIDIKNNSFSDNYKLLTGSVLPRPIAVISTLNSTGSNNLAPFSFFTAVSSDPMIIAFCPVIRSSDGEKKDTLKNIERTGEFVVNFVQESYANKINISSKEFAYGEDEFSHAGLTPVDSKIVKPKRLKESPINFECKLRDILSYGSHNGAGTLVTGEVLYVHVDEKIYFDGKIDTDLFAPIGRGAGPDWIRTKDRFQQERLVGKPVKA
jgi:flavin reductase (DIM6/NTAB) family NADH-FMN oxidoreductase RutF